MGEHPHPLLIISARVLLNAERSPHGPAIFRRLAKRTREGTHLLLTAGEPDQWFPTRSSEDDVLGMQGRMQDHLQQAGGDFDGIYYVPRSVFTQDRKRTAALEDILVRYGTIAANATLVSSSKAFLKAAERLGIAVFALSEDDEGMERFLQALDDPGIAAPAPGGR